jgi:cellulose synthase/poly-beta-1,6-N-acetylglucosamine synthase-like glycosyltransferase
MRVKVVFATRNGGRTLPHVLAGHAALQRRPEQFVVVDNGSNDDTPAILAEAARAHPGLQLTVLREIERGKNRALNAALPLVADADLVAFTDDDAVPAPDWLDQLVAAAEAAPRHAIFGGAIEPGWMAEPPDWLFRWRVPLDICFAANSGLREGPVSAAWVWGPNMAIRGEVLRAGHRFDTDVGPDGTAVYPMGSETEFTRRLERAGYPAWFAKGAMVRHLVRPEQMQEAWVLGRAYRCGLGAARVEFPDARGLPLALEARRIAYGAAAPFARRLLPPGRLRFWLQWQSLLMRGMADGVAKPAAAKVVAQAARVPN